MKFIAKKFFLLTTIFAVIYGCTNKHSIGIRNRTAEAVTLLEVSVDGTIVSQGVKNLDSSPTGHEPDKISYYEFKSNAPKFISVSFKDNKKKSPTKLTCRVNDSDGGGCFFWFSIRDGNKTTCACDPYSDFSD
jgi:hypothetical protein